MADGGTTLENIEIPLVNSSVDIDFDYYLPRVDLVYVDGTGNFIITEGIPGEEPEAPAFAENTGMLLYEMYVPAYTFTADDVFINSIENKRYTMRDIGKIEKRIDRVEYYTTVSLLEKETDALLVTDAAGNERFTQGFLVDSFLGYDVADVGNADMTAAIAPNSGELYPAFSEDVVALDYDSGSSTNVVLTGDIITLPYTETPLVTQLIASEWSNVNPYNVISWIGEMALSPAQDIWSDRVNLPTIVNRTSRNDNTNSNVVGSWVSKGWREMDAGHNWPKSGSAFKAGHTGIVAAGSNAVFSRGNANETFRILYGGAANGHNFKVIATSSKASTSSSSSSTSQVGGPVTIPWMRSKAITVNVTGLKPNTEYFPMFDGIDVTSYVAPSGGSAGDSIISDNIGSIAGLVFTVPNSSTQRFRTGTKVFSLDNDNSTDAFDESSAYASAQYSAQGTRTSFRSTVSVSTSSGGTSQRVLGTFYDPLAQTFFVDGRTYTEGCFVSSVDVYMRTKSDTNVPLSVSLAQTQNGYPVSLSANATIATKSLPASSINISSDATAATTFTFDTPIYLPPGEFAIILMANSQEYEAYTATMGEKKLGTTERISEQPHVGSLFKSQNASTWTATQESDLMFEINRCVFDTATPGVMIMNNEVVASDIQLDVASIAISDEVFSVADIAYAQKTTDFTTGLLESTFVPFDNNSGVALTTPRKITTSAGSQVIQATLNTTSDILSPVIDVDSMATIAMGFDINNLSTNEEATSGGDALSRYVTRRVTLVDGFDGTNIKAFAACFKPSGSDVKMYYKILSGDDEDNFEDKSWVEMTQTTGTAVVSGSKLDDFIEFEWMADATAGASISYTSGGSTYTTFKTFAIKVVLLSTSTVIATNPRLTDLRVIAVA